MKKVFFFLLISICWTPSVFAQASPTPTPVCSTCVVINDMGTAGAPVGVAACGSGSTQVIFGSNINTTWTVMCEADSRCTLGDSINTAPAITPTATAGFLFKANQYVNEASLGLGSTVVHDRMDCCGVAGATSCDSWRE
jgi:hypothetical protein